MFDILGTRVRGARFLDVYAGTGAVGCEALSREAAHAELIERDRDALNLIADNLRLAAWPGTSTVVPGDARRALRDLTRRRETFDIVFLDPPYDDPGLAEVLVLAARLLSPPGVLILEHRSTREVAIPAASLRVSRSYRYGDTSLTICRPASGPAPS